ncbi:MULTISPECIES: hypothetical protein [Streptomycetaceae]|uniref:Uncharacterized protein n=1 Tax=Streptantibioticus cattleyicolor (strain ATCC 35852 / DSM 46488 / JCM 4925 / NBRC 14057 / NRRL 8057) TaxID=1003195 RepID=F8K3E4_STREN|nr:hypothetical protein [Streptantibioticus cattleyicolor]AEW95061.1 hypothetical protein SCATT_26900 [Streptantibioticus cattleyicolor NRRL 8057 = DSM 46488]MYS59657.1 hypothetical protein [Streptomyces sp. SID5468]CCB75411.1 conserved exported protein of unknown function [Streptantibioticus cattleyicolor NRRL 8057 = DSM 46488]
MRTNTTARIGALAAVAAAAVLALPASADAATGSIDYGPLGKLTNPVDGTCYRSPLYSNGTGPAGVTNNTNEKITVYLSNDCTNYPHVIEPGQYYNSTGGLAGGFARLYSVKAG